MKRKIIFFLLLTVAILGALFVLYLFRPVQECVCKVKAQEEVAATDLVFLYENDEETANQKYLGKVIVVEGIIADLSEDAQGRTIVELDGNSMGVVSCTLCSKNKGADQLQVGKTIKIKGECAGYTIDVVLLRCCIE